jgi:hypothetical protein
MVESVFIKTEIFYNHTNFCYSNKMKHATGTMKNATGIGKPGDGIDRQPHLGDIILQRYEKILHTGFEELKNFELIDRLEKPVLDFMFTCNKKKILEVYNLLSEYPYAFSIRTKKGFDLWSLPDRGIRNAYVYISRFPKLIKFINKYENEIPSDVWGILFGYPLSVVHPFTYDWETWIKGMRKKHRNKK